MLLLGVGHYYEVTQRANDLVSKSGMPAVQNEISVSAHINLLTLGWMVHLDSEVPLLWNPREVHLQP